MVWFGRSFLTCPYISLPVLSRCRMRAWASVRRRRTPGGSANKRVASLRSAVRVAVEWYPLPSVHPSGWALVKSAPALGHGSSIISQPGSSCCLARHVLPELIGRALPPPLGPLSPESTGVSDVCKGLVPRRARASAPSGSSAGPAVSRSGRPGLSEAPPTPPETGRLSAARARAVCGFRAGGHPPEGYRAIPCARDGKKATRT